MVQGVRILIEKHVEELEKLRRRTASFKIKGSGPGQDEVNALWLNSENKNIAKRGMTYRIG